jgi:hypothetical protein
MLKIRNILLIKINTVLNYNKFIKNKIKAG